MDKISAKQIEGVVDTTSRQTLDGEKTFTSPTTFLSQQGKEFNCMCIDGLNLYWLITPGQFDQEGNKRLGVDPESGVFGLQEFKGGRWNMMSQTLTDITIQLP